MQLLSSPSPSFSRLVGASYPLEQLSDEGEKFRRSKPRDDTQTPFRITERLDEQQIAQMITDYHACATGPELAERYGISLSSVKRLLRMRRARRFKNGPLGPEC